MSKLPLKCKQLNIQVLKFQENLINQFSAAILLKNTTKPFSQTKDIHWCYHQLAASDKWCFSGELLNIIYTKTGQPEKKTPIFLFGMKTVCTKSQTLAFDLFWLILRKEKWKWQLQVSVPCSIFPNKSPLSNKGILNRKKKQQKHEKQEEI